MLGYCRCHEAKGCVINCSGPHDRALGACAVRGGLRSGTGPCNDFTVIYWHDEGRVCGPYMTFS